MEMKRLKLGSDSLELSRIEEEKGEEDVPARKSKDKEGKKGKKTREVLRILRESGPRAE